MSPQGTGAAVVLPPHLRLRLREGGAAPREGRFVLYWMRTAVRAHENPALDVALLTARSLGVPLFVYHALSERYPYASHRHHRFILEGARDVQQEMRDRGMGYAFHLEREGHRGPHLRTLARQAAVVVTEDMPVSPLREWTSSLARECPVWEVDAACLAPFRRIPASATTRAFKFRKAAKPMHREWSRAPWPTVPVQEGEVPFLPDLPFEPVELGEADLDALIAACRIDHSVGPVPHTPGGTRAGYARWQAFRNEALPRYAWERNDALKPGVSRMSAYLHYGQVSPFRLAREAAAVGGKGGDKYLDELLVWRELAYAFCAHQPGHDTLAGLPGWAVETLAAHEGDRREELSWERLARGQTGDALWDAAQRSLLTHGELHNNVRMTWGKAVLGWSRNAEHALERLQDLNHRYALDGRDPASYGGILWCLGQFDRPFEPEQRVFGTVRPRSTRQHAKRLDVREYARRVEAPAWEGAPSVGVVGGGLAGLLAARILSDHGLRVTVFDKGRRPGGRANTRVHGDHRFDHGAQYFTARDPMVRRLVTSWVHDGVAAEWTGRLVRVRDGAVEAAKPGTRYVGTPGMIALAQHLSEGLDVRSGRRITGVVRDGAGWRLEEESGTAGRFDQVVVAVPAPQAVPLLEEAPELRAVTQGVGMSPCWAVMLAFDGRVDVEFDGAFLAGGPASWMARDSSKPGRPESGTDSWVIHASPEWTREHWDLDRDQVPGKLLSDVRGHLPEEWSSAFEARGIVFSRAHRWAYALAGEPLPRGHLYDPALGIGAAGDWCWGGRVEGALLSGSALAGRILGQAPARPGNPLGRVSGAPAPQTDLFAG